MTTENDAILVQTIRDATSALNTAISAAHDAGLTIEVRFIDNRTIGREEGRPILSVFVSRRLL